MTTQLQPDQRVNWWQVIEDLRRAGMTTEAVAKAVAIPKSTLLGYKNLAAEPRHADGERLLALWRATVMPAVPVLADSVRQERVTR